MKMYQGCEMGSSSCNDQILEEYEDDLITR